MSNQAIFFRHNGALKKLNIDEIIVMVAADNYVKICVKENYFTVRTTLEAALSCLPPEKFLRVHRSYAVSIDYINKIDKDSLFLIDDKETEIPISRQYYQEIIKQIVILDATAAEIKNSITTAKSRLR
jgi:DNA-binding LytR/AlgR family response regulator